MNTLPKLTAPKYKCTIPSTGKTIKFRPFLVKEEKILLMSKNTTDINEIVDIMKSLITSCSYTDIDIDSLATFDIEYIFLQIRAKSVGEEIELNLKCLHQENDEDDNVVSTCNGIIPVVIKIDDIQVTMPEKQSNVVKLTKDVGIVLRYPTLAIADHINESEDAQLMSIVLDSIVSVYEKDTVYHSVDIPKEEMEEFVNSFTTKQMKEVTKFFDDMPHLEYTINYKCPNCGNTGEHVLRNIVSFFQ